MSDEVDGTDDDTTGSGAIVISLERPGANPSGNGNGSDTAGGSDTSGEEAVLPSLHSSGDVPAVLVDQRMERRRLAVEMDARDRRYRRYLRFLLPLALIVAAAVIAHLPMVDVDEVLVEGAVQTPPAAVLWASHVDKGDPLATLDADAAEARIEALPWIAEAKVVREWPGTVRIAVSERVPVATLLTGEGRPPALVDEHGRVLDIDGMVPPGLIELTGLQSNLAEGRHVAAKARPALQLAAALGRQVPGAAVGVDLDLDVSLAVGGIARFGSDEKMAAKLLSLQSMLADVDTDNLAVLDLRVPSNPTIIRG